MTIVRLLGLERVEEGSAVHDQERHSPIGANGREVKEVNRVLFGIRPDRLTGLGIDDD